MDIKFLAGPALLIEGSILVIADLHLGIELDIGRSGITVPAQMEDLRKRVDKLLDDTRAEHLILLGDIKHQVPGISWQEMRDLPGFLEHFSSRVKLSIVKGNHDGNIENLVSGVDIYEGSGFRIGKYAFAHGHAWMSEDLLESEHIILAHLHPAIELESSGVKMREEVWLRCPVDADYLEGRFGKGCNLREAIILPAFNRLSGTSVFNAEDYMPIGPLLRNKAVKWEEAEVFLLDGTFLGNLRDLRK